MTANSLAAIPFLFFGVVPSAHAGLGGAVHVAHPLALLTRQEQTATLELQGREFVIRQDGRVIHISTDPKLATASPSEGEATLSAGRVVYRKDENFAVWDSRGLTIRKVGKVRSSKLIEISESPKVFARDEILRTKELIKRGQRRRGADGLSGSRRVGDTVYFLARWDESDGVAWLEALVSVDLSSSDLHWTLVGLFNGLSLASGPADQRLYLSPGKLSIFARKTDGSWGQASYDLAGKSFAFTPLGKDLLDYWRVDPKTLLAEEKSGYGSKNLVRISLDDGARRVIEEFRGDALLMQMGPPILMRFSTPEKEFLRNMDTGAELSIQKDSLAEAVGGNVLVWPLDHPERAELFSPDRWMRLAAATIK